MLTIMAYSALVSVVTLGVLLLRRTLPQSLKLWTYRYGSSDATTATRLKVSAPPLLLWLLVVLITLSFAAAYYRDQSEALSHASQMQTSVWIDRSVSSHSVLSTLPDVKNRVTEAILREPGPLFLIQSKTPFHTSQMWKNRIELVKVDSRARLEEALASPPSPFAFDLSAEALKSAYDAIGDTADQHGRLIVVSDGQRSTIQKLSALAELYSELVVIDLPSHGLRVEKPQEIVPTKLLSAWGLDLPQGITKDAVDFVNLDPLSRIPLEARPGLYLGRLALQGESHEMLSASPDGLPAAQVFSKEGGFVGADKLGSKGTGALFTHCTRVPPGPSELSPLSDLQILARFLDIKVRTIDCAEGRATFKATASNRQEAVPNWLSPGQSMDPWAFRRASLWLVPLSETVFNTLLYQKHLWLPDGFRAASDSLFYFAEPGLAATQGDWGASRSTQAGTRYTLVQLEEAGLPLGMMLAPPPPVQSFEGVEGSFVPSAQAYDKTDLVYRLGDQRVYYLRTPLAMPNGELGRTGFWPSFWLQALRESSSAPGGLVIHHLDTPDAALALPAPQRLLRFDTASMRFRRDDPAQNLGSDVQPGLFADSQTGELHLIEFPPSERSAQFLGPDAIREALPLRPEPNQVNATASQSERTKQTPVHAILGAIAGALALLVYWLRLRRSYPQTQSLTAKAPPPAPLIGLILGALCWSAVFDEARAQGLMLSPGVPPMLGGGDLKLPEPLNVAFRMSWCSAETGRKEALEAGFKRYRDMLADRGTIHLQNQLLFGACVPGASEIWWTDSADDLDPDFLKAHVQSGGIFVIEGFSAPGRMEAPAIPAEIALLNDPSVGLRWEQPEKRGMLYRSFYLLQTFDGCVNDQTMMLTLRKKQTAKSPVGVVTSSSFFQKRNDCFKADDDYRNRSFVNLMYALLTTDYKEDQLQLPELLRRVRNLGLEP